MFREWVCSEFPADKYIGILTEVQSAKRRNHLSLIPATNAEFWRLRYNKSNHLFFLQDPGSNMDRLCMHHRYPGGVQSLKSTRNWDPKSHFILKFPFFPVYFLNMYIFSSLCFRQGRVLRYWGVGVSLSAVLLFYGNLHLPWKKSEYSQNHSIMFFNVVGIGFKQTIYTSTQRYQN